VVPEVEAVGRLEAVILVMRGTDVDETEPYLEHRKDVGLYLVIKWIPSVFLVVPVQSLIGVITGSDVWRDWLSCRKDCEIRTLDREKLFLKSFLIYLLLNSHMLNYRPFE
jgi:hypothetical protein